MGERVAVPASRRRLAVPGEAGRAFRFARDCFAWITYVTSVWCTFARLWMDRTAIRFAGPFEEQWWWVPGLIGLRTVVRATSSLV